MMRFGLRGKILLFTALTPVVLALGTLWMVNHSVSRHLHASIYESLTRSSSAFENIMSTRAEALTVAAQVIVRDPRFFSILTLPAAPGDPQVRATVEGVARDFNTITRKDLFEILDRKGQVLASVGPRSSSRAGRAPFLKGVSGGKPASGILVEPHAHFQVTVTPVVADRRVVGTLILGAEIGQPLARQLRSMTRSQVTFVSDRKTTGSTFTDAADRRALLRALESRPGGPDLASERIFEVKGASETYLTLVRRIPHSRPESRQLYVMQRSLDTETAFLREVRKGLLELGILAIVVALAMGFMVSERITRPVRRLVRGAEEMEQGNYEFPLEVHSRDEIGYLADRFQDMRHRQRDYVNSLQEVARLKTEFINVASHELRTPISVIKGFAELFTHGGLGAVTSQQKVALEAIQHSLGSLIRIAEDATRMAQIEGERLRLSIGQHMIKDVIERAAAAAVSDAPYRDLTITTEVHPELGSIQVDGARLTQAIANLVRNGIRFTPDGGFIDVTAKREGSDLVVVVRDTGIGIAEEKRQHLFVKAFAVRDSLNHHSSSTLEFNSAGLGLGLLIVHGIVEAHGGTISVTSHPGQGSTFVIRLPMDCRERESEAA